MSNTTTGNDEPGEFLAKYEDEHRRAHPAPTSLEVSA